MQEKYEMIQFDDHPPTILTIKKKLPTNFIHYKQ